MRLITFTWANAQWLHGDNFGNINSGAEDTGILHRSWASNYVFASITRFSRNLTSQGWQAMLSLGVVSTMLTFPISHLSEYVVFYYNLLQFFKQLI